MTHDISQLVVYLKKIKKKKKKLMMEGKTKFIAKVLSHTLNKSFSAMQPTLLKAIIWSFWKQRGS